MTAVTNRPRAPSFSPIGISGSRRELKFSLRETLQTPLSQSARFTDVILILTCCLRNGRRLNVVGIKHLTSGYVVTFTTTVTLQLAS